MLHLIFEENSVKKGGAASLEIERNKRGLLNTSEKGKGAHGFLLSVDFFLVSI